MQPFNKIECANHIDIDSFNNHVTRYKLELSAGRTRGTSSWRLSGVHQLCVNKHTTNHNT